jgi:hypothetical protein
MTQIKSQPVQTTRPGNPQIPETAPLRHRSKNPFTMSKRNGQNRSRYQQDAELKSSSDETCAVTAPVRRRSRHSRARWPRFAAPAVLALVRGGTPRLERCAVVEPIGIEPMT